MLLRKLSSDIYPLRGQVFEFTWSLVPRKTRAQSHRNQHFIFSFSSAAEQLICCESLFELREAADRHSEDFSVSKRRLNKPYTAQATWEERIIKMVSSGEYEAASDNIFELFSRGFSPNPRLVCCMIICYSKLGNIANAGALFNDAVAGGRFPSNQICEGLLIELCRKKMFLRAVKLFKIINADELRCSYRVHTILISNFCSNGLLLEAKELLTSYIERSKHHPSSHHVIRLRKSIFYGLCKKGLIAEAKSVIIDMEETGHFVDKVMYTTLINLCCKRKKLKYAMQIYLRMLKMGCESDAYTLRTLIHGFVDMGLFKSAWELCNKLDESEQLDDIACHFLMAKYCKKGKIDCAKALLSLMGRRNVAPTLYHYTSLLKALLKSHERPEAEALYRRMMDDNIIPDHILFFIFLSNTPKSKVLELTLLTLATILIKGTEGPPLQQISHLSIENLLEELVRRNLFLANIGFAIYITALCKLQRLDEAFLYLRKSIELDMKPLLFTFNSIISCLCSEGMFDDVESLVEIMQEQNIFPDTRSYFVRIKEHCKRMDSKSAITLLREFERNSIPPNVVLYDLIISCLCKKRKIAEAETLFEEMIDLSVSPDEEVYCTMINGYFMNRQPEKALKFFERMKENSVSPSSFTYTTLITGLVHFEMIGKACSYTRVMQEDGFPPNIVLFTSLINHFLKKKNVDVAFRLIELVGINNLQPDVKFYGNLVTSLCRLIAQTKHQNYSSNNVHVISTERLLLLLHDKVHIWPPKRVHSGEDLKAFVLNLLEKIEECEFVWSSYLHNVMILGFCWCDRIEKAHAQLEAMVKDGFQPNQVTFSVLSNAHIRRRELTFSVQLFNEMGCLDITPDWKNYNSLFVGFGKAGKVRDALCAMCLMYKRGFSPTKKMFHKLLHCLCEHGDLGTAVSAFEEMVKYGYAPRKYLVQWLSLKCTHEIDAHNHQKVARVLTYVEQR